MSISTIIHVKNSEAYIEAVLESWYKLSDDIIVLNNGSTDRTVAIAKTFNKVIVINDFRKWTDVGENVVRNDALRYCNGKFVALPDSDEVLFEDQEEMILKYLEDDTVGAWKFRSIEYFGDHHHIQDIYRGPHLDGVGEEVFGFGRQAVHGRPFIYRNHRLLNYSLNTNMLHGLHCNIMGSQRPGRIMECLDIKVAHYGYTSSNESIYNKTIFYYNSTADPNGVCRTKEFQDKIDPNNPLGYHDDQAVRPPFMKPPKYMIDHPGSFHRIRTAVDDGGKCRIVSRSDVPLPVEIKIGTPHECGRGKCEYIEPVIDVDLKRKANEFTVIRSLDYYTPTVELCAIHPNVFVNVNENIPYNVQYDERTTYYIDNVIHRNARHIIAVSTSVKSALLKHGVPEEKISVINFWGCNTDIYRPIFPTPDERKAVYDRFGISTDKRIVLFAGRICDHKGLKYLMEASSMFDNAVTVIIGTGDIANYISYAKNPEAVKYIGSTNNPYDMSLMYNMADVTVLPSIPTETWIEQFGRVITESLSCGTPVVATNMGGPLDIIDHDKNGYLINPFSAYEIAHYVNELLGNRDKSVLMGMAGRLKVENEFSDRASYKRTMKCITDNLWK
jgi:glycosyltransferase involved in cell wall biosynthesis